jgi:Big-like domain-containing protein
VRLRFILLLPLALACDSTAPRDPAELRATSGDGQVGKIGTTLPSPLVVTIVDRRGAPLRGAKVTWTVSGGNLESLSTVTDEAGQAEVQWTLGLTAGTLYAKAAMANLDPAIFTATALSSPGGPPPQALQYDKLYLLEVPTYDGSGQVVHPDYAGSSAGLFKYPGHLAITPYPFGNPHWENPSVFAGGSALTWLLENGTPNPLLTPSAGYLSDPDLVYIAETDELWLYYRQVTGSNLVHLVRSHDGIHWSLPVQVAGAPNHEIISPTVVHRGPHDWWMWAVNGGATGCGGGETRVEVRHSEDGRHWSAPGPVDLLQPGFFPWHIDVEWIPSLNEFWAVYNVKLAGSCTTPAVFLATSPDGINWTTRDHPLLAKGSIQAFADVVYRSTFSYDPVSDDIVFWYSGARYDGQAYVWSAAVQRRARADVFRTSQIGYDRGPLLVPAPAELEDWP